MAESALTPSSPSSSNHLSRELGARDAAAIMISNMVGVGILTLPGVVALAVGSLPMAVLAWALGGVVTLAGALVHAELGCRYPMAGGDYVFLREAFGALPAFLSGWTSFVVGFPGGIALSVMAATACLLEAAQLRDARWSRLLVALIILVALTLVHVSGLRWGKRIQNFLVVMKLGVLLLLVVAGWLVVNPPPEAEASNPGMAPSLASAALIISFAYTGWNASAHVAGEIRNPRRNLPMALIGSVLLVTVLYVAVNLTYFRVIPSAEMGKSINVGGEIARHVFGTSGGRTLSAALIFIFLGSASAMIVTGPRIYYAMACDGLFPRTFARLGASSRVPASAIWFQTLWTTLILVLGTALSPSEEGSSKTFETIASWTAFAILPFAALTTCAVFVLRRRDRSLGRSPPPFKTPGYPWSAIALVAVAVAVELAFLGTDPGNRQKALIGCALIFSGIPAYFFWRRRSRTTT